ncbi:hypothetical protein SY83_18335 [Paenibacillus swuensis]|uniref:Uncharacterized protein n=1 Tax=Paenibacillus swuensis TaxID=1178515 RepID=A0A172TLJ0_9BACL|nr:hypothetical protein [Paenibacillus swuensis]ANE47925.1 hypothetical protein SY83_18335 [Paenibacillus swuensis]
MSGKARGLIALVSFVASFVMFSLIYGLKTDTWYYVLMASVIPVFGFLYVDSWLKNMDYTNPRDGRHPRHQRDLE